jgi:hypothetical protein
MCIELAEHVVLWMHTFGTFFVLWTVLVLKNVGPNCDPCGELLKVILQRGERKKKD